MSAGFTGARSLGDRRRRRLAQDADRQTAVTVARRAPTKSVATRPAEETPTPAPAPSPVPQPRDSIIPFAPWKLVTIGLIGLSLWLVMLVVGQVTSWQPAFQEILGLQQRRLPRFFSTICLLAATQLSCLILWYRIRSKKDFSGRYRTWFLALGFWGLTCFCVTTGTHVAWANWAYLQCPIELWRGVTFYWLVPTVACFLALHRLLQLEMRLSRASRVAWDVTWYLAAAAMLTLLMPAGVVPLSWQAPLTIGAETLWHLSSAFALLLHARFVVHVTNEAAPKLPPRIVRVLHSAHVTAEKLAQSIPRPKFLSRIPQSASVDSNKQPRTKATTPKAAAAIPDNSSPPTVQKEAVAKEAATKKAASSPPQSAPVAAKPTPAKVVAATPLPTPANPVSQPPKPVAPSAPQPTATKPTPPVATAPVTSKPAAPPLAAKPNPAPPVSQPVKVRIDPPQPVVSPPITNDRDDDDDDLEDDDGDTSALSRKERRRLKKQKRTSGR